jgi:hypothetical protein
MSSVLRVRLYPPPRLTGTEVSKGARYAVAPAAGLHGIDLEVIGSPRLQVIKAHTEHRQCVIWVQPDRGSGCLGQGIRICTIVHNPVMHRGPTGIIGCPADNRQMLLR